MNIFLLVLLTSSLASAEIINTKVSLESEPSKKIFNLLESISEVSCESDCTIGITNSTCSIFDGFMIGGTLSDAQCSLNFVNHKNIKKDDLNTQILFYSLMNHGVVPICWSGECSIQFNNFECHRIGSQYGCSGSFIEYRR